MSGKPATMRLPVPMVKMENRGLALIINSPFVRDILHKVSWLSVKCLADSILSFFGWECLRIVVKLVGGRLGQSRNFPELIGVFAALSLGEFSNGVDDSHAMKVSLSRGEYLHVKAQPYSLENLRAGQLAMKFNP